MHEFILRIAIDCGGSTSAGITRGSKWEPGSVLMAHPMKDRNIFQDGDFTSFLIASFTSSRFSLEEAKLWRLKKKLVLSELMPERELSARLEHKTGLHYSLENSPDTGGCLLGPKLDKPYNLDKLTLLDTDKKFLSRMVDVVEEMPDASMLRNMAGGVGYSNEKIDELLKNPSQDTYYELMEKEKKLGRKRTYLY